MQKDTFTKAKEAEILTSDYSKTEFGTISLGRNQYICAIDTDEGTIPIDNENVELIAKLRKSNKHTAASLVEAVTHATLSTVIPGGAGLAGAFTKNAASAAAGIAAGSVAKGRTKIPYDYQEILILFRNGKRCIVRCSKNYIKSIQKKCTIATINNKELCEIIEKRNSNSSQKDDKKSDDELLSRFRSNYNGAKEHAVSKETKRKSIILCLISLFVHYFAYYYWPSSYNGRNWQFSATHALVMVYFWVVAWVLVIDSRIENKESKLAKLIIWIYVIEALFVVISF